MNNIIDFVIKIQDMGSGVMQRFASAAQTALRQVDQTISRSTNNLRGFGGSISVLNTRLAEVTRRRDIAINTADVRSANREIAALEQRISRLSTMGAPRAGGGGGGGMRLPGWMAAGAIAATMGAATLGVVKAGATAQQDLIGLTTFLGAKQAKTVYSQIQQDAAATPFGTKGLLSADRALISAGVAADKARLDVLGLANAIAATGGGDDELARMALNMQQIKNAGEATAADIKQFGYAGINIYQLLANATGKTAKQAKDMTVTYDLLAYSLRKAGAEGGLFAGAMEAQSKSISGKWSTLMDNIDIASAKIALSQSNAITGLIDKVIGITERLPAMAEQWSGAITEMVKSVISFVGTLIDMAKWVYQNWHWLKYVVGTMAAVYAAVRLATIITATYNGLMMWAAIRTTAFAVAGTEAAAATGVLNATMLAGPWGWAALAIAGVGIAITALISKTNELKSATDGATGAFDKYKGVKMPMPAATLADYHAGTAKMKPWGGYEWKTGLDAPLTATETKKYQEITSRGAFEHVYAKQALAEIRKDRMAAMAKTQQAMVINMPKPNTAVPPSGGGKPSMAGLYGAADTTGKSITAGGGKSMHIHIGTVVGSMVNNVADGKGAIKEIETGIEEVMARVFGRVI